MALSKKAQPVWFRLTKWTAIIVCGLLFWRSVYFWWTLGVLLIVALILHVIWRWKTKAWTQPWGGWHDLDAGR